MALAPLGHVLYSRVMKHDPADPQWPDRDRFVLSNGHASILQYSLLYLSGYGLELDDLEAFRQFESRTPGHPGGPPHARRRGHHRPARAGLRRRRRHGDRRALALRARFGTRGDRPPHVRDRRRRLLDGGRQSTRRRRSPVTSGSGKLICVYDDNRITIDGDTARLQRRRRRAVRAPTAGTSSTSARSANDLDALDAGAPSAPRPSPTGRRLLVLRSHIGYPSPDHTDDYEAHGLAFDADDVTRTKAVMGIPDEPFWSPPELVEAYRNHVAATAARPHVRRGPHAAPTTSPRPSGRRRGTAPASPGWTDDLPTVRARARRSPPARRSRRRSTPPAVSFPGLVAGAADLTGNTGTKLEGQAQQSAEQPGRAPDLLRRARARDGRGDGRHGDARRRSSPSAARSSCSPTTCARRSGWRRCREPRCASCSPTTRSASARTGRRTNRSSSSPRSGRSPACT